MKRCKTCLLSLILIVALLLTVVSQFRCGAEENVVGVVVHIPGEQERERFNEKVMVTGLWHYVNVTLDETVNPSRVALVMYKGDAAPLEKTEETYYSWEYDGGVWRDNMGYGGDSYTYIDETKCARIGSTYVFYVATDDFVSNEDPDVVDHENWTLAVKVDDEEIFSTPVVMEEPVAGVGVTRADFTLSIEPFTQTVLKPVQEFVTTNTGNVPLYLSVSYGKYDDLITTSNVNITLHPGETLSHSVEVATREWRPGYLSISGRLSADAMYVVPTGFISFETSYTFEKVPRVVIQVGHSNYELEELESTEITFQYKKNVEMDYGETRNITAYVCGEGNVTLSIVNSNITLLNVWSNGVPVEDVQNFMVHSTSTSEHLVVVQLQATKPNVTAYLTYTLDVDGALYTYTTVITVGPEPSPHEEYVENTVAYIM
ncbi:MAG TPA: hypothetical protein ENI45_01855, partial [Thermoplasmatales archaeon]|nr:hypothetical protein [Thermoplasmatales archaeon]